MNYERLLKGLAHYGRKMNFDCVCQSYKPQLRESPKYKQWKRLQHIVTWKTFTEQEKAILNGTATIKIAVSIGEPVLDQTAFGQSLK